MKKVLFIAFAALAFAFTMTACGGNNEPAPEATDDTTAATEQCDHKCMHEGDSTKCCKAEGMAQDSACCKKAEGKECCKKAEGKECEKKCQK